MSAGVYLAPPCNGGAREHITIGAARGSFPNPQHVVPALAQADDAIFRDVLVGAEPHGARSAAHGEDLFVV